MGLGLCYMKPSFSDKFVEIYQKYAINVYFSFANKWIWYYYCKRNSVNFLLKS